MMNRTSLLLLLVFAGCATAAKDETMQPRKFTVTMTVPDAGWRIAIDEIYRVEEEVWILSVLRRTEGMAAQVLSTVSDTVEVPAPPFPEKHFVLGKRWQWKGQEPYSFLRDRDEIRPALENGERLYRRPRPAAGDDDVSTP